MDELVYNSAFTGAQIDSAVSTVSAKEATWDAKAESTQEFEGTLPATGWSDAAPYTQSVIVDGIVPGPACADVLLDVASETAITELEEWGKVDAVDVGDGVVTVTCLSAVPKIDLAFHVAVAG